MVFVEILEYHYHLVWNWYKDMEWWWLNSFGSCLGVGFDYICSIGGQKSYLFSILTLVRSEVCLGYFWWIKILFCYLLLFFNLMLKVEFFLSILSGISLNYIIYWMIVLQYMEDLNILDVSTGEDIRSTGGI